MNTLRRAFLAFLITGAVAFQANADFRSIRGSSAGYASVSVGGPSVQVDVGFFYNELSPYGRWFRHADYGWVWTPRIVHTGWRPYSYGRWVDSDYGWTWASDEPFGWATYHYGRWAWDPDYGWIWLPGSVWGPAWVSWQEGDGYIGWAPLPPSVGFSAGLGLRLGGLDLTVALAPSTYVFVPERSFLEPGLTRYAVAASYNTSLCRRTRNVTRYGFSDNRVINTGLSVDRIERATHRRVQRWRVAEVRNRSSAGVRGNELRVFRPAREQLRTVRVAQRNDAGVVRNPRRERTPLTAPNRPGEPRELAGTPRVQGREQQRREAQQQANRTQQQRREAQQQQTLRAQQQRREAQQQSARAQQERREAQQHSLRAQQQRREAQQQRREMQQQSIRSQQQRREAQQQTARAQQERREAQRQSLRAQQQRREAQQQTARAQQQRREAQQQAARAQQERREAQQQRQAGRGQQRREAQRGQGQPNAPQRNPRPRHRPSGSGGGPGL